MYVCIYTYIYIYIYIYIIHVNYNNIIPLHEDGIEAAFDLTQEISDKAGSPALPVIHI